jgi:hypothetical protein
MKHDKLRDMVRSILPSRDRIGPPRAKAGRKRAHRRAIRAELRQADTAADLLRDVCVRDIVQLRRDGDKLNHFMRWCESITEGMSTEEALAHVRGILPHDIIGDHAYGHWYVHRKYPNRWPYVSRAEHERRKHQSYHDSAAFRLRRALGEDPSLHHRLNAEIKSRKKPDEPRRLLLGLHDVEAFIDAIEGETHRLERDILFRMIEEIEKGGQSAALRFVNHPLQAA